MQPISNLSNKDTATKPTKILNIAAAITPMVITIREETVNEDSNETP
jgi:hypothetical protein